MDEEASAHATIVDLLSHRTGLAAHDLMYIINDTVPDIVCYLLGMLYCSLTTNL